MRSFYPAESGVSKHYSFYSDNDRRQVQNEVMAHWDARGQSITIEGDRLIIFHPADVLMEMEFLLMDSGAVTPPELDTYAGVQKWVIKWIVAHVSTHGTIHVPHLQAKRKWGKTSSTNAYSGRRGFTGVQRRVMFAIMSDFHTEVIEAQ